MEIKLGRLIEGEAQRDAIHIAIAPVVAAEVIYPGSKVLLRPDGKAMMHPIGIGIADPYYSFKIDVGEKFWLFLFPNTLTGMRHHWTHPKFPDSDENTEVNIDSINWMKEWAANHETEYDYLIKGTIAEVTKSRDRDSYVCLGQEDTDIPEEFWYHFTNITGINTNPLDRPESFRCAC